MSFIKGWACMGTHEGVTVAHHNDSVAASNTQISMSRPSNQRNTILRVGAYLMVSLAVLLAIAGVWLATGVRSIEFLKPYVQSGISDAFAPFRVEAGRIRYTLDTNDWALVTGLRDVTLYDAQAHRVAAFSEVNLDLGLASLLTGAIRFQTLEIVKPALRLTTQEDGRVTLSVSAQDEKEEESSEDSAPVEVGALILSLKELAVKTVVVRDAFLGIVSKGTTATYRIPRLMLITKERGEQFAVQYDARIREKEKTSRLTGSLDVDMQQKTMALSAALVDFNASLLATIPIYGEYLAGADMRLNGTAHINADYNGNLQQAAVEMSVKEGQYRYPAFFKEPLMVDALSLKAHMEQGEHILHIEEASFANDDMNASVKGDISFLENGVGMQAAASIRKLRIDRVGAYWPPVFALDARDWITTNLSVGTVEEADATINFTPETLAAEEIPAEALNADLTVKNATVGFLPGYPQVQHVNGKVRITARSLDIVADSGDFMRGTTLKAAHLQIPDFNAQGIPMEFSLTLDAQAADVAEMIGAKRLNLASALQLNPDSITGKADGVVNFTLPLYSAQWPKENPYITYDITAALDHVSQEGVLGKWNISGMSGDLAVNNKNLSLQTQTKLQDIDAELGISREFVGKKTTTYTLVADIPREQMPEFGFTIPQQIQGVLGVDAKVTETDAKSITNATVNLADTTIRVDDLNYKKARGVPATLAITQEAQGAQNVVPKFTYHAEGAEILGSYTQDRKSGEFARVELSRLKLGANDFTLHYTRDPAGRKLIHLKGETFDMSSPQPQEGEEAEVAVASPKEEEEANPLDALLNARIELDLRRLLLSAEHGFKNVSGFIDCGATRCPRVDLHTETQKGVPFTISIDQQEGKRHMTMASQDGGGVIRAFDISDHVVGGVLDFRGDFDDSGAQSVLNGRIALTDFRVVKGPILVKLLSLASLTGFLDTLAGNGIAFTKLSADTIFSGTLLRIKNGKAYGSAIGITMKGKIKPFHEFIDLEGAVVPAYTANSIIGKIPVLGDILTGGEGGGVIAANYSIRGNTENPDVLVNPLSLLTPGFLRKLFDVFDAPENDETGASGEPAPTAPEQQDFPTIRKR